MPLAISKGVETLKRIFRGLDFDLRASLLRVLDLVVGLGQGLAD